MREVPARERQGGVAGAAADCAAAGVEHPEGAEHSGRSRLLRGVPVEQLEPRLGVVGKRRRGVAGDGVGRRPLRHHAQAAGGRVRGEEVERVRIAGAHDNECLERVDLTLAERDLRREAHLAARS